MKFLHAALFLLVVPSIGAGQETQDSSRDMADCPMHQQHAKDAHRALVEKNGEQAMGFSHEATTHHFRLKQNGGVIEVSANDLNDKTSAAAIRSHLSHIAELFAQGDFSAPMFIHDGVPPGVTTMQLMKTSIQYRYEESSSGGRVRIESSDAIGVAAIHDFLRFQINEHHTEDALTVSDAH